MFVDPEKFGDPKGYKVPPSKALKDLAGLPCKESRFLQSDGLSSCGLHNFGFAWKRAAR
jgi:hypothetical protein